MAGTNVWAVVAGVTGYLPMTALTGATGQLLGMNAAATAAEWKAATFLSNQLALPAGTVGAPARVYTGSLASGWYQPAAGQEAWSFAGTQQFLLSGLLAQFTGIPLRIVSSIIQEAQSANIAAAATTDLGTATGNYVYVTNAAGNIIISSLGGATLPAGTEIETKFVITGGTVTLLQDAVQLPLLGGANIAVQNGTIIRWRKTNGAAAYWEMVSLQTNSSTSTVSSGIKNRIINGDMRIDQANCGTLVSVNAFAAFNSVDQWIGVGAAAAGVFSMQRQSATPPVGFKNYLRIQTTTADAAPVAGSQYYITNRLEGLNVIDFQLGQAGAIQLTLSLQMRSSLTGTFSGSFTNFNSTRSYPWTCTITAANTWTPVIVTLTGDVAGVWNIDNTIGLVLCIDIGCGATLRGAAGVWAATQYAGVTGAVRVISTLNATLDVTAVQLERGAQATAWEYRDIAEELVRCQRYYGKSYDLEVAPGTVTNTGVVVFGNTAGGSFGAMVYFKASMRAAPTITHWNPVTGASGSIRDTTSSTNGAGNAVFVGQNNFNDLPGFGAGNDIYNAHWTADARL